MSNQYIFYKLYISAILQILFIIFRSQAASGLMGYDCGTYNGNHSRINLKDMKKCAIPRPVAVEKKVQLQLLQTNEYWSLYVKQCSIEVKGIVTRCGLIADYVVAGGFAEYFYEPKREECKYLHERGRIVFGKQEMTSLKRNSSETRTVTLEGSVKTDGSCTGEDFSDGFSSWVKVIVTGSVKITLRDYYAKVYVEGDLVYIGTGSPCSARLEFCALNNGAYAF